MAQRVSDTSTVPDVPGESRLRKARALRRTFIVLLFAFIIAGLAGVFGVRTTTATASAGGYELEMLYTSVTRPGLATPWAATVRHAGGFDGPLTIAVSSDYFEMFDENGLDPDASKATADADFVYWEFEPPPDSDELEISFDARIEPARQWGQTGVTKLLIDDRVVTEVAYRTWVLP